MVTSITICTAPIAVKTTGWFPHTAVTVESQLEAKGRQIKKTCRTLATHHPTLTPKITQVALRKDWCTKMRR